MAQKPLVLVVDDEPDSRDFLCIALVSEGYDCHAATSGDEAKALLRSMSVSLIIIDLMMPGVTGDKLAAELRADARTTHIPLILCTGKDPVHDERALFDRTFVKPMDMDVLIRAVRELTA